MVDLSKKLGSKNAKLVLKAFESPEYAQHFGFLKENLEHLANLPEVPRSALQAYSTETRYYNMIAGCWMIMIGVSSAWIEITIFNPRDLKDDPFTAFVKVE